MLTSTQKQQLRAQAHHLHAVVIIGHQGLTESVIAEIDRALNAHELIKIKWRESERSDRSQGMDTLCQSLAAEPIAIIGKHLVLWREKPQKAVAETESPSTKSPSKRKPVKNAAAKRKPTLTKKHYRTGPGQKGQKACNRKACSR